MAIPDFQTLLLPVLREFTDGQERSAPQVRELMARHFGVSPNELSELLPSGRQTRFANRVAWALAYLRQAKIVESPRRGAYRITGRGREVLSQGLERIDLKYLMQFPEVVAFRTRSGTDDGSAVEGQSSLETPAARTLTPDEQVREAYQRLRANLAVDLIERVKRASPQFFEQLVVDLLIAMGYGGSHEDAARVVGRSGDGGIDGIIKEDRLGLDSIYIQAKRWDRSVGRPDVQQFAGALQGRNAHKGVMITTSEFTREALAYASGLKIAIVLVDGDQLAQLMLDHGVGVSVGDTIKLQKVDEDYFLEE